MRIPMRVHVIKELRFYARGDVPRDVDNAEILDRGRRAALAAKYLRWHQELAKRRWSNDSEKQRYLTWWDQYGPSDERTVAVMYPVASVDLEGRER